MNIAEAEKILSSIQFMNLKFSISEDRNCQWLWIDITAPNTKDRTQEFKTRHNKRVLIESIDQPEAFINIVFSFVLEVLRHEAGELFKVNGLDPFNEHFWPNHKWSVINEMFTLEPKP